MAKKSRPRAPAAPQLPRRKVICFPLPNDEIAPFTDEVLKQMTQRIVELLYLDHYTVEIVSREVDRLMLCLFHGDAPQQTVDAFNREDDRPQRKRYTPNKKLMLIVDVRYGIFYVAAEKKDVLRLLKALNGVLFPTRPEEATFETLRLTLNRLPALLSHVRNPIAVKTPHEWLRLRGVRSVAPGKNGRRSAYDWPTDGFEEIDAKLFAWPTNVKEVRLEVQPKNYDTSFLVRLFNESGVICVQLSDKTLDVIPFLLGKCTDNFTARRLVPYESQREFQFRK